MVRKHVRGSSVFGSIIKFGAGGGHTKIATTAPKMVGYKKCPQKWGSLKISAPKRVGHDFFLIFKKYTPPPHVLSGHSLKW